jgi:WD40 repeat protein
MLGTGLSTGKHRPFVRSIGPGTSLAWSPDGTLLACGAGDSVINLWSIEKSKVVGDIGSVGGWIYALAWMPDGKSLFAGCQATEIVHWDIAKTKPTYPLKGQKSSVMALAVAKDGSTLVSGDMGGNIGIWDVKGKKLLHLVKAAGYVRTLAMSPVGDSFFSSADGDGIKVWHIATGKVLDTIRDDGHAGCIAFGLSTDGQMLAYGSLSDSKVRMWDLDKKTRIKTLEPALPNRIMKVDWSADGKTIAATSEFDNRIYLWEADSGNLRAIVFSLMSPHGFILSPRGDVSADPEAAAQLVYVVQTERGQETLSAAEFAGKYQWKNDPKRALLNK